MNLESERIHKVKKVWVNVCRFLLGGTFIFSGFVKAVDPYGTFYKLQDYLTAFGIIGWFPSALLFFVGILLAAVEFCVGVYMFLGIRKTVSAWLALLLMIFMTPLTLYLAIADPVSDCGCFGDAVVLTNWQTFGKTLFCFWPPCRCSAGTGRWSASSAARRSGCFRCIPLCLSLPWRSIASTTCP